MWACGGKMKIQPVEFKVLIKPDEVEEQTPGGLWLTDETMSKQQFSVDRGEIIAFGEGFYSELPGPTPKVGDKVLFNKYAGTLFDVWEDIPEGAELTQHERLSKLTQRKAAYRLINDKEIFAILEE
jgi:co-chaperonin GroES (HSP10)